MGKKICVVGAGYWGQNHIKTLAKLNALGGIVDLDKNTLNKILESYPGAKQHTNINDALDLNYDGYIVATPAQTHFEIARKIIKCKKHLLIEKPMTLCIQEAENLVKLVERFNVNVLVGHLLLFHPAIKKIKKMILDKEIGDLQYIYSNRLNLGKVRTQENVFWSFAPHDIALFQYLTGSTPEKINATGSTFLQKGIPDSTLTQLEYKNGVKGHIFVSWLHPFKEHRLIVIGSKAMISYEDSISNKPLKFYSKKIDFKSGVPKKIDGPVDVVSFKGEMPLELELKYFIKHLSGEKVNISNVYDGYEVVKTLVKASNQI